MDTEVPRRLRAARVLAGLTLQELADKLDTPGLGFKTLGAIERGERPIRDHELAPIAQAMDVPLAFFERDPRDVRNGMSPDALEVIAANQAAILVRLDAIMHALEISPPEPDEDEAERIRRLDWGRPPGDPRSAFGSGQRPARGKR